MVADSNVAAADNPLNLFTASPAFRAEWISNIKPQLYASQAPRGSAGMSHLATPKRVGAVGECPFPGKPDLSAPRMWS